MLAIVKCNRVACCNTGDRCKSHSTHAIVTVAAQQSKAMADQIMAADKSRLKNRLDTLSRAGMLAVEDGIRLHPGLPL